MTSESEHKNAFHESTLSFKFSSHDNSSNLMISSNVPRVCIEEPCILGVDEAGRGPVLGPMVYGICYCPISKAELLKDLGCADSKTLTEEKRKDIFTKICQETESLGWIIEAIAPNSICNAMLKRQKYSLNQVAQDSTVLLIKKALETGVNVTEVYVDTVGPSEKYQDKLLEIFPHLKITVAKKADSIYPIVSAASICAKVSRDEALNAWTFPEQLQVSEEGYGSGYPNDPVTKTFLSKNIDLVFGFPQLVRFSWSTADRLLQDNAAKVEWEDEEEGNCTSNNTAITAFFKVSHSTNNKNKHGFFQERNLTNMKSFE